MKQRKKKRPSIDETDELMFKLICRMETSLVAQEMTKRLGVIITVDDINQRFHWIRKKRPEWQHNINVLNNAEKMCKNLEKRLTPSTRKEGAKK